MKMKKTALMLLAVLLAFAIMPITALGQASQTVKIVNSVNFREKPSTSGKQIRLLKTGETVELLSKYNSYWLYVKDSNGKTGYVSNSDQYVQIQQVTSSPSGNSNATIVSSVNFRKGPSTSYESIRLLKKGEKVLIVEQVNSNWYKVKDAKNVTGYVSSSSQYIETSYKPPTTTPAPTPTPTPPSENSGSNNSNQGSYNGISRSDAAAKVIAAGKKYLGTPYEFGSNRNSTATFDCSAFVKRAFLDGIGQVLPSDSRKQGDFVKKVGKTTTDWKKLQPGDLMFFMSYKGTKASDYSKLDKSKQTITHVGIYLGNGQILHTYSKDSGGVRTDSIVGKHWEYRFLFGGPTF